MKKSKNISSSMRLGTNDRSSKISPNKRKTVESHVEDKRLKLELASIKKEIANLNKLNSALVERLDYKEEQKRSRKIQSK